MKFIFKSSEYPSSNFDFAMVQSLYQIISSLEAKSLIDSVSFCSVQNNCSINSSPCGYFIAGKRFLIIFADIIHAYHSPLNLFGRENEFSCILSH